MAALVASQRSRLLCVFDDRLAAGQPQKVAVVACLRTIVKQGWRWCDAPPLAAVLVRVA